MSENTTDSTESTAPRRKRGRSRTPRSGNQLESTTPVVARGKHGGHGGERRGSGRKLNKPQQSGRGFGLNAAKQDKAAQKKRQERHTFKYTALADSKTPFRRNFIKNKGVVSAAVTLFYRLYAECDPDDLESPAQCEREVCSLLKIHPKYMRKLTGFILKYPGAELPFELPRRRQKRTPWLHGSKDLTQVHVTWLTEYVKSALREGLRPCIPEILQKMRATFDLKLEVWTLRRLLKELDFRFGKLHIVGKMSDAMSEEERNVMRRFIMMLDYMLKQVALPYPDTHVQTHTHTQHTVCA